MSYGGCENRPEEVTDLRGGKITSAKIVPDEEFGTVIEFTVEYRRGHTVKMETDEGTLNGVAGIYQVWADPEGNGPGFLSLVGVKHLVPANAKTAAKK